MARKLDPKAVKPGTMLRCARRNDPGFQGKYLYDLDMSSTRLSPTATFLVLKVHVEQHEPPDLYELTDDNYWGWPKGVVVIEALVEGRVGRCAIADVNGSMFGFEVVE